MKLNEKIERLNKIMKNCLSITRYNNSWFLISYHDDSPLKKEFSDDRFDRLIDKAYDQLKIYENIADI